ncbi:uncharacterized protein LOC143460233 isoform X2 [Clavelina lepadiformis]|uniref:uncharacterized protein LOC143460233 isoform X2 n=1 Tax=Clavelina lepadiformis TaxID=159417 RepID=UPI004042BA61
MDKAQRLLIIVALLANIAAIVFGYFNATNAGGFFNNRIEYLNKKYYQEIAPTGIAFSIIWPIIYFWNIVGTFYLVVSMCLPAYESPVNYKPTLISKPFLVFYIMAFGSAITWLFTFDREMLVTSAIVLAIGALSVCISLGISCKRVYDNLAALEKSNQALLWLVRILVQNALAILGTWLTLATFIGVGISLIYADSPSTEKAKWRGIVTMEDGSTIMLSILLGLAVAWFVFQNFICWRYFQGLFVTFPVLVFAYAGILVKLQNDENAQRNFILACVGVGVCSILFLIRLPLAIYRMVTNQGQYEKVAGKKAN